MNRIKVSMLATVAFLLGICGTVLHTAAQPKDDNTLDGWFKFNGGDESDPNNYTYYGITEPCDDVVQYCAMKGDRQASPNQLRPTQASVNAAKSASSNFTIPVADLVHFEP